MTWFTRLCQISPYYYWQLPQYLKVLSLYVKSLVPPIICKKSAPLCKIDYYPNRRGYRISWRGRGGGWRHSQAPPPPLGIVRVTSSTLRKIEKHPHSWTFTSTPPWTLPVWRHPHSRGGGGDRPLSRTLCIGFQYREKFKGGGDHPCHPPGSATAQ